MRAAFPLGVLLVSLVACSEVPDAIGPANDLAPAFKLKNAAASLGAPVYELETAPDGSLLAAEAAAGIVELRKGVTSSVNDLLLVTGIASIGRGSMLALTGSNDLLEDPSLAPIAKRLYRVSGGNTREIADLGQYEEDVNPDQVWNGGPPDSNPFNLARLNGGATLVADAAANAILHVSNNGAIDWVAVLTPQDICPFFIPNCMSPQQLVSAQPVATSVDVGPDGHYYASELTGFPGNPGSSRVWRILAGSRHVLCPSAACTQVAGGLTSVMDIRFGPDGLLYVVEFDAASWLAVEMASGGGPLGPVAGGTVKACNVGTGVCAVVAAGLSLPTAISFAADGTPWIVENGSIPGVANVHPLF